MPENVNVQAPPSSIDATTNQEKKAVAFYFLGLAQALAQDFGGADAALESAREMDTAGKYTALLANRARSLAHFSGVQLTDATQAWLDRVSG